MRRQVRIRGTTTSPRGLAAVAAFMLGLSGAAPGAELFTYLMNPSTTGVTAMVHTDDATAITSRVRIRYGATTNYGSTARAVGATVTASSTYGARYVYTVRLTNLAANTLYHYQVSVNSGTTWSADASFKSAPGTNTSFRFGFYADFRSDPATHDAIAGRILNTDQPAMLLNAGDVSLDNGYSTMLSEFWVANERALLRKTPFFYAPGNHEGWSGNTTAFFKPVGGADYYAADYGDLHVVSVNNYASGGYAVGSAQYNFVQADLAVSRKPWKIVFYHEPAYTAGNHGENAGMKAMSVNLFVPNQVAMTLAGHNHFYQHNLVSGIHHMVIGSVGAPLYAPVAASYTVYQLESYCYGIIDVSPGLFTLKVYNKTGSLLETVVLDKRVPAAPTNLAATAVSPTRVQLAWADASTNETGFRLERRVGTTGAFARIAGVASNLTAYADTNAVSGTQLCYRVVATNANGDSPYANEASVTTPVMPTAPPTAPQNLAAAATAWDRIDVTWVDASTNESGFRLERKAGAGGSYATIASLPSGSVSYPDAGLAPSTEYFYRLRATNVLGEALCTNEARAVTPSGLVHWWRLDETGGVTAADSAGTNHGVVTSGSWTNGQLGGGLFLDSTNDLVEPGAPDLAPPWAASAWVKRSNIAVTQTILGGDDYTLDLIAANSGGKVGFSQRGVYDASFGYAARADSWVHLAFVGTSSNISFYAAGALKKTLTNVVYCPRRWMGSAGRTMLGALDDVRVWQRPLSAAEVTALAAEHYPAAPTTLAAAALTNAQIRLTWKDNADNEAAFVLERRRGAEPFAPIAVLASNTVAYTDAGLLPGATYTYRIRATNDLGASGFSNDAGATTLGGTVPVVNFAAAAQASADESGAMIVTAVLSTTCYQTVTVPFTVGGTATAGVDHAMTAGPMVIPEGQTTGAVIITILPDTIDEPDRTIILTLGTPTNATRGAVAVHVATIVDDDPGACDGLLAWWQLDEAAGTLAADSAGTNTGTLKNGPVWTAGVTGSAVKCDGANDFVTCGGGLELSNRSFSLAAWVRRGSTGTADFAAGQGLLATNRGLHFGYLADNRFTFSFFSNNLNAAADPATNWTHWVGTFDATTGARALFRNGQLVATDTAAAYQGTGVFSLGTAPVSGGQCAGTLDDVRVYGRVLSPDEVSALCLSPGFFAMPVFTTQPAGAMVLAGQPARFTAAAAGNPLPGLQWQVRANGSAAWLEVAAGGATASCTVMATAADDGSHYRCVATNGLGSATSEVSALAVLTTAVWVNAAGGSWPAASNWMGSLVATGAGITADFGTLDLTADATVSVNGARTVGGLVLRDTTPGHRWTLAAGAGGPLTLAATSTPVIDVDGSATISAVFSGAAGFAKAGPGTLTLSAASVLSNVVTVSAGTLLVNGSLAAAGPVSVAAGATLGGTGLLGGATTIQGTLAPGAGGVGVLVISNLLLFGTGAVASMEIHKAAGTGDVVRGLSALTYGGALAVTNLGGALEAGDSFRLFAAGGYTGSFSVLQLPDPGLGHAWDTSWLAVDGTLRVADASPWNVWVAEHFAPPDRTNVAIAGHYADPDGDHWCNLLEYAFNRNPRVADAASALGAAFANTGAVNTAVFLYPRRKAPRDITYLEEIRGETTDWAGGFTAIQSATADTNGITETVRTRLTVEPPHGTNLFFRVRVTMP